MKVNEVEKKIKQGEEWYNKMYQEDRKKQREGRWKAIKKKIEL